MEPLEELCKIAKDLNVVNISNEVLKKSEFTYWSGSSKPTSHHFGNKGLVQHVWEVVSLCMQTNCFFKTLNKDVSEQNLFLAALFHDVGKIWDYVFCSGTWMPSPHKSKVHHISRSALVWQEAKLKHNYIDDTDEVLHAILSHHGRKEYSSPVTPTTRLAWILHSCDQISARVDDCEIKNERLF